jgi:hypothetical protein
VQAKRTCWGVDVQLLSLLNSALDGSEWSGLLSGPFKTGERPLSNQRKRIWMGSKAGLDVLENRKIYCPDWDSNYDFSQWSTP